MSLQAHFAAKRPRYQIIAEGLAAQIESGALKEGELLPSEAQLCETHGVSRHTVREAIRALAGLGLVDARPGIGTRVVAQTSGGYVQTLKEIADLNAYVKETSRRVIRTATLHAAEAEIELPGSPGKAWRMVEALRHVVDAETVIAWTEIFVLPRYGMVLDRITGNDLVYQLIEREYGIRTQRLRQDVYAVSTPERAASFLGIEPGAPGLAIRRDYFDEKGEIFECTFSIHPPDRYRHSTEFKLATG